MSRINVAQDLRAVSELKVHGAEIVRRARSTRRPVVLTQRGRGVAVVLSAEQFEELQHASEDAALQRAVDDAERDVAAGHLANSARLVAKLKRRANGRS